MTRKGQIIFGKKRRRGEEKGEDGCTEVLERDEGGEKRREYDFDRGKVGALDREASQEGCTIGSSPCRSARGKRDSLSRLGVFRRAGFPAPLLPARLQSNVVLYLSPLYREQRI